jgi:hypothetical protein
MIMSDNGEAIPLLDISSHPLFDGYPNWKYIIKFTNPTYQQNNKMKYHYYMHDVDTQTEKGFKKVY